MVLKMLATRKRRRRSSHEQWGNGADSQEWFNNYSSKSSQIRLQRHCGNLNKWETIIYKLPFLKNMPKR